MTWSGRKVTSARARWARRLEQGPVPCYRCHRPVYLEQRWQVEHMQPRALGGAETVHNEWVSHAHCNASHGGRLGAATTNARRAPRRADRESEAARGIRGW